MKTRSWCYKLFLFVLANLVIGLSACGGGGGGGFEINFTLKSFIVIDDLNADGLNDIAVTKIHVFSAPPHPGYVAVILQDLDAPGSFLQVNEYPVGNDPWHIAISDFNSDAFLDLIVTNTNSASVSILLHDINSPGNFLDAITVQTGLYPNSTAVVDLNNDGYKDLAVCCGDNLVTLHFQDPENQLTFLPVENISIPPEGNCANITVADFDGNGLPDLAVASTGEFSIDTISSYGGSVYVFFQNETSSGSFLPASSYPAGDTTQPIFVAAHDFNKDGLVDIAAVNYGTTSDGSTAGVAILLQDPHSHGTFLKPDYYATGHRSGTLAISDLNADGWADLAVSNAGALIGDCDWLTDICTYHVYGSISVLFQKPGFPGNFLPAQNIMGTDQYLGVGIGDLNGDLRPDIAIAADGVPVLFQDPAIPGIFFSATAVETGSSLP